MKTIWEYFKILCAWFVVIYAILFAFCGGHFVLQINGEYLTMFLKICFGVFILALIVLIIKEIIKEIHA